MKSLPWMWVPKKINELSRVKSVPIKLIKLRKTSWGRRDGKKSEQTTKVIIIIKITQEYKRTKKKKRIKLLLFNVINNYCSSRFVCRRSFYVSRHVYVDFWINNKNYHIYSYSLILFLFFFSVSCTFPDKNEKFVSWFGYLNQNLFYTINNLICVKM